MAMLQFNGTTPPQSHEIKHDGFRVIARKQGNRVRLYSRPG
jgi:ATP-dependent DNA ligase